jgi:hypothetical protein
MPKKIKLKGKKDKGKNPKSNQYEESTGRVAFSKVCSKYCLLCDWTKQELKLLIKFFKKLESMWWKDIKLDGGFRYETIQYAAIPRPTSLPPDATLKSLRVNECHRLYGYRAQDTFNIIWFDRNHIVCPMGKPKNYAI